MNAERRRFVLALAALPAELALARVAGAAEKPPPQPGAATATLPPRKPRVLDAPIKLRSGQRLENLDLTFSPRFRWSRSFAAIYGSDVENVVIRNVTLKGPDQWQSRWTNYREPKGSSPIGIPAPLSGIKLHRVKRVTLEALRIEGLPRYAITGYGYDDCVIRDVDITRCVVGITIKHNQPSHRLLVEGIRVRDTWGPDPSVWPGRARYRPSKLRPGGFTGGNGVTLDTVREGILRNCDVRGEHFGSYKLVNAMNVEVYGLEGMNLMVQGTADKEWKIHKQPSRNVRVYDCKFDKSRGTGRIRRSGNVLQISWHVRDLDIRRCQLDADGQGGNGIQLAVDCHANVTDCTFRGFNGTRGGKPCYAADVWKDCTLNDDFEQKNTFVDQQRIIRRRTR